MSDITSRLRAKTEMLENENEHLRFRIEELERLIGLDVEAPIVFGLTSREACMFGALMARDMCLKEHLMASIYGALPDDDVAEPKIIDVFVCKMRKKLRSFDIEVETIWGKGYRLSSENKVTAQQYFPPEQT